MKISNESERRIGDDMTLDQIKIALTEPGKLFDAGYDDCLEGKTRVLMMRSIYADTV